MPSSLTKYFQDCVLVVEKPRTMFVEASGLYALPTTGTIYLTSQVLFMRRLAGTYRSFILAYKQVINKVFYLLNYTFSVLSPAPTNTTKLIKE